MSSNESTQKDDDQPAEPVDWDQTTQARPSTPQSPSLFDQTTGDSGAFELATSAKVFDPQNLPIQFGCYTLEEIIGEGGAGVVFKATPKPGHVAAQGHDVVAVKLIRPEIMASPKAAKRFEKESRLHAEVESPYVTRHLEFGCQQGVHYIVSEFVDGVGLDEVIDQLKSCSVKQSLRVVADILKALAALHRTGVIHRDVKPGNVIASFRRGKDPAGEFSFDQFEIAKLTDFGLARHIEQSESLAMTRQQTMLGTPLYMAPEQYFESRTVDARADIYSVGVTLYQMLAGHPPFKSSEAIELAEMHRVERPRPLTLVRAGIREAISSIVMKALEKEPALRYQNASEMLADVERAMNDQPTSLRLYPETPDALHPAVRHYEFEWTLNATPKKLWPLASDTDRFNQAIGLPAPKFSYDHSGPDRQIFAEANFNGMKVRWREFPFQWILEREMSVFREFKAGPFEWVSSTVELHPLAGDRTRLIHRFQVKPRGLLGKLMTPIQFKLMTKRSLNRVYARLEEIANDTSCGHACDVSFSKPVALSAAQQKRLAERTEQLAKGTANQGLAKAFSQLLASVADPFAARIRPIPLSEQLGCSLDDSLQICLRGVEVGLLNMSWDVICPVCRISASNVSSISRIEGHGHCEVCNLDFEIDFSKTVEVIFSTHPEIRPIEIKTYCIGGPFHAPHVLAQNRLLANQFVDIGTVFKPGRYEVRGPQIADPPDIKVQDNAIASRLEIAIGADSPPALPDLHPGLALIHIANQTEVEILVRVQQAADREDSVTAATACQHPLFKQLFPQEVVEPAGLVDLANVYLLAIKHLNADELLDRIGDIQVREYWTQLQNQLPIESSGCQLVECTHELLLVSFEELECLLDAFRELVTTEMLGGLPFEECCFTLNSGEIMIGSQANQPAAFGKTVRKTKQMLTNRLGRSLGLPNELYRTIAESELESAVALLGEFTAPEIDQSSEFVQLTRQQK